MSKKKHEWTRKGVTASMAVVLAFGMVPAVPGVALATTVEGAVLSNGSLTSKEGVTSNNVTIVRNGNVLEGSFETIDSALAKAEDGDTIKLASGKYEAPANAITKCVSLEGEDGTEINGPVQYKFSEDQQNGTVVVQNVTISANDSDSDVQGLQFRGDKPNNGYNVSIQVNGCTFKGWKYGVTMNSHANGYHMTVSDCDFAGSLYAVSYNYDTQTSGQIADNTLAFDGVNKIASFGFAVQKFSNNVVSNYDDNTYRTIEDFTSGTPTINGSVEYATTAEELKDAISNAKEGATIVLAPGTYNMSAALDIDKSIDLIGAGKDRTVIKQTVAAAKFIDVANVDFSMTGINVQAMDSPADNNQSAICIGVGTADNVVSITDCKVSGFSKNGITVKGGVATIENNVITCGPYSGAAGNGIQIDEGAKADVSGNSVVGYVSQAEGWSSTGLLVLRGGNITEASNNTFSDCENAIVLQETYDDSSDETSMPADIGASNSIVNCGNAVTYQLGQYSELEAVLNAARSGDKVVLYQACNLSKNAVVDDGVVLGIYADESWQGCLTIAEGVTFTVEEGGSMYNNGAFVNNGTFVNNGAFASNGTIANNGEYQGEGVVEVSTSDNLESAISMGAKSIKLLSDIVLTEKLSIDKDVVIDGNGCAIKGQNDGIVYLEITGGKFELKNAVLSEFGGELGTGAFKGVIYVPSSADVETDVVISNVDFAMFNRAAVDVRAGSFSITGGQIDCRNSSPKGKTLTKGILAGLGDSEVIGTISGVTVTNSSSEYEEWGSSAIEVYNNADVDIANCTINNVENGIHVDNYYGSKGQDVVVDVSGTTVNATADALKVYNSDNSVGQKANALLNVASGNYTGNVRIVGDAIDGAAGKSTISITGGTYSSDPSEYVEAGYVVSGSNPYVVGEYVAPAPPSGGSSSGDKDEVVTENPDGSTTTTVTEEKENADGSTVTTVTETTEGREDGSVTEKVTETTVAEDGTKTEKVTETNTLEDGTSATTVTVDGELASAEATVTEKAVESAGGKAVELPMAPVEAASSDKAVEVKVQAPAGAKVAVPVAKAEGADSVAPGAVLVLVDAEGDETVLSKTANTGEALSAEIPGDCTLKVVDASASFPDVASGDWYAEQGVADFVSARGVMTGVETETGAEFQGDAPTNRGMFVTMLNRLEMEAKAESGEGFADVDPGSWYAGSSAWAVEAGIATGYENADGTSTFDGDGNVTREQMAAFLFRYAQWLGLDTSARAEGEVKGVSDYAKEAMSWAVAEGLIKGDDTTGAIRPADGATRAEAAAVVMRMIELMA